MRQQRHHELSADAASAKGWPDVEPPHAQSVRNNWFNRETTNARQRSVDAHSEQGFAGTVKPHPVRLPIGREPFDLAKSFGERFRSQVVKAGGQLCGDNLGFHFFNMPPRRERPLA